MCLIFSLSDIPTEQTMIYHNDETVCYNFSSSTSQCDFDIMSLFLGISGRCNILIDPPHDLNSFNCYNNFHLFNVSVNISLRQVCLSNWTSNFSSTVVHFLCLTTCPQQLPCNVYNYVSSHQVVMGMFTLHTNLPR